MSLAIPQLTAKTKNLINTTELPKQLSAESLIMRDAIAAKKAINDQLDIEALKTSTKLSDIDKKLTSICLLAQKDQNAAASELIRYLALLQIKMIAKFNNVAKTFNPKAKYQKERIETICDGHKKLEFILGPKNDIFAETIYDNKTQSALIYNEDPKAGTAFELKLPQKIGNSAHIRLFKDSKPYAYAEISGKGMEFDLPNITQEMLDKAKA